jgi:hypothetical protein
MKCGSGRRTAWSIGARQPKDQRYANAYVFGAISRDTGTALASARRCPLCSHPRLEHRQLN